MQFYEARSGPMTMGTSLHAISLMTKLPHLWHKQYYLGATHIFGEVACRLTSNIVGIGSARKKCKDVNIIHGGKCPTECTSICFNNYLTSSLPICVQSIETGIKLNARRKSQISTASPRYLNLVTRRIPYMIGLIFKKILGNLLVSLLEIGSLPL